MENEIVNTVTEETELASGEFAAHVVAEAPVEAPVKKPRNVKPKYERTGTCKKCGQSFQFMQGVGKPRTICDSCK